MADLERAKEVLTIWSVDSSKGVDGVKKLAKEIREETKLERDLDLVRKQLVESTGQMESAMKSVSDAMGKVGMSTSMLAGGVGGLVATIGTKLVAALGDAVTKLGAFIESGDDFNDTVEEDRDSVWRLTEATQHMGNAMEVARFRAKLMASEGLKPTETQLEALTVAATRLASKQKTEWHEAAEKLSNTWQGMGTRALKPLNLAIDQNLALMDRQKQMLEGLANQGAAVLTQAEKEKALIKEKDDAYLHLSSTMNDNDLISKAMNFGQVTRIQNEIKWVKSLEQGWNRVWFAIQGPGGQKGGHGSAGQGGYDAAVGELAKYGPEMAFSSTADDFRTGGGAGGTSSFYAANRGWAGEAVKGGSYAHGAAGAMYKKPKTGGGSKSGSPFGIREWVYDSLGDIEKRAIEMIEEQGKRHRSLMQKQREGDVEAGGESERLAAEAEFKKFAGEQGRAKGVGKLSGTAGAAIYGDAAANAALRSAEAFAKYKEVVASTNAELQSLATGGIQNVYGGLVNIADAAISGADNIGLMALGWFKSITLGLSNQLLAMGIAATIEGTGLAASVITAPLAAGSFAKAGIFYAGAGTMLALGLGASAISAAVGGGGGAPASTGRSTGGTPGSTPSFGKVSEDRRPLNINVYLGDPDRPDLLLLATKQIRVQLQKAA